MAWRLNWTKIEFLPIRCVDSIFDRSGQAMTAKTSMVYLGSLLSSDGSIGSEVSRRIGIAMEEFKNLKQVWNHSHISRYEKLNIFTSCTFSKLTYALHTAWLNSNIRRRLNRFHCKCLRQILNILPLFLSRISNHDIFYWWPEYLQSLTWFWSSSYYILGNWLETINRFHDNLFFSKIRYILPSLPIRDGVRVLDYYRMRKFISMRLRLGQTMKF